MRTDLVASHLLDQPILTASTVLDLVADRLGRGSRASVRQALLARGEIQARIHYHRHGRLAMNHNKVKLAGSERQPIGTRVGDQPDKEMIEISVILKPEDLARCRTVAWRRRDGFT